MSTVETEQEFPKWWEEMIHGRPPTDPTKSIKVIGAGLPRTGTASLAKAVQYLFQADVCHAGTVCLRGPEWLIKGWTKALNPPSGTSQDEIDGLLRQLLSGYVAVSDAPGCYFVEELCRLYPDAVVICTVRDPEDWWESSMAMLRKINDPWRVLMQLVLPTERLATRWKLAIWKRWHKLYPPGFDAMSPSFIETHTKYVKSVVPEDRLFFFNVKDGWEPLCKILNRPVPTVPFPKQNPRSWLELDRKNEVRRGTMKWAKVLGVLVVVVAGIVAFAI